MLGSLALPSITNPFSSLHCVLARRMLVVSRAHTLQPRLASSHIPSQARRSASTSTPTAESSVANLALLAADVRPRVPFVFVALEQLVCLLIREQIENQLAHWGIVTDRIVKDPSSVVVMSLSERPYKSSRRKYLGEPAELRRSPSVCVTCFCRYLWLFLGKMHGLVKTFGKCAIESGRKERSFALGRVLMSLARAVHRRPRMERCGCIAHSGPTQSNQLDIDFDCAQVGS
ncbi:hypothetical protein KCV07_g185, partial [Aureobasidium melanogenum]